MVGIWLGFREGEGNRARKLASSSGGGGGGKGVVMVERERWARAVP